jgi:predicted N-acyltransferase
VSESEFSIDIAEGVAELKREEWNRLVGDGSPFLEWDWLASLEEAGAVGAGTGWLARPLVVRRAGRLIAACPLYVKGNSQGEFVHDWGWADAAERAGIRYYPKVMVGVPFTPVGGQRFLVAPGEDRPLWERRLAAALREFCKTNELSGVHVNFCVPSEVEALSKEGYLTRIGIQYHWLNSGYGSFDDYLARFRSKRRNQIRRERREMEKLGVQIQAHTGDEIPDELFRPMFDFYLATIQSRFYGRQYLNFDFFELLRERFRHRLVFIVASRDGCPIAGTFNVTKGNALYGRYWGALQPLRHLHFNVCYYAAVEYCIAAGLDRFEPGAGGDYKQMRGFDAQPTWSGHFLADPRLAEAIEKFLEAERSDAQETIGWLREQSALKKPG